MNKKILMNDWAEEWILVTAYLRSMLRNYPHDIMLTQAEKNEDTEAEART